MVTEKKTDHHYDVYANAVWLINCLSISDVAVTWIAVKTFINWWKLKRMCYVYNIWLIKLSCFPLTAEHLSVLPLLSIIKWKFPHYLWLYKLERIKYQIVITWYTLFAFYHRHSLGIFVMLQIYKNISLFCKCWIVSTFIWIHIMCLLYTRIFVLVFVNLYSQYIDLLICLLLYMPWSYAYYLQKSQLLIAQQPKTNSKPLALLDAGNRPDFDLCDLYTCTISLSISTGLPSRCFHCSKHDET